MNVDLSEGPADEGTFFIWETSVNFACDDFEALDNQRKMMCWFTVYNIHYEAVPDPRYPGRECEVLALYSEADYRLYRAYWDQPVDFDNDFQASPKLSDEQAREILARIKSRSQPEGAELFLLEPRRDTLSPSDMAVMEDLEQFLNDSGYEHLFGYACIDDGADAMVFYNRPAYDDALRYLIQKGIPCR